MTHFSLHRKFSAISAIACVLVATFIPAAGQVRVKRGIPATQQVAATPSAPAAAFTSGNIVIYRIGTGVATLSSAAQAAFLDEYTPAGVLVQSIALPTAAAGANHACTNAGTSTSEGMMTRSSNGLYLLFGCYDAAPGTLAVAGTSTGTVLRVAGRADAAGNIDTSTATTSFSTGNIRSATSDNGTNIWMAGSNTGLVYATLGTSGAGTIVAPAPTNTRSTAVFGGQLFVSSGSGTSIGINSVGTGLPTTAGTSTLTNTISDASNTNPIVITTPTTAGLSDAEVLTVSGVLGNTNANVTCYIKVLSGTTFAEYFDKNLTVGRAGNAVYTSGGTWNVFTNPVANQVVSSLAAAGSPYQFFFVKLGTGITYNGFDTAYLADDSGAGGIQKYTFDGTNWVATGTATAASIRGLTGRVVGSNVQIFGTTGASAAAGGGTLFTFTDSTGFNGVISGAATSLATAATNTVFRGVALAPGIVTAAGVTVSGHVLGNNGLGVRNARVTITDQHGVTRTATTNAFGYYSFDNVMVGEAYIVSAGARGYSFPQRLVQVFNSLSTVDITPNR